MRRFYDIRWVPFFLPLMVQLLALRAQAAPLDLHVSGNQIVNSYGCTVRLRGVNQDGLEWSKNGEGPAGGDGGNTPSVTAMAVTGWGCNVIRLPLDQDYWFGCNGANQATYRNIVDSVVNYCAGQGVYCILDLHWSGTYNGTSTTSPTGCSGAAGWGTATAQQNMPDWNAVTFWSDVASHYSATNYGANSSAVLFDIYNEPHLDSLSGASAWTVWKNGGATGNTPSQTPGMQALLAAIRAAGANNVVLAGGLQWAYDLTGIASGSYVLSDPSGQGVVYSAHIYGTTKGTNTTLWDNNVTTASTNYPIFLGEFGPDTSCPPSAGDMTSFNTTFFNWLGGTNNKSYVYPGATGWSMHNGSAPCMLANWQFTPTSWGVSVVQWLGTPTPTCVPIGPTYTYTPSSTPTASYTPTSTRTPTNSPTVSSTRTATGTPTNSYTPTPSPTATMTWTATNTGTFTGTWTATLSPTDTSTGQPTSTPTDSPTLTETPTVTDTPTSTLSPTDTFTGQPTATGTDSPTPTPTGQPTATASPTPSPTASSTRTSTATYTWTASITPSATWVPTKTWTPTSSGGGAVLSQPYPNPSNGGAVNVDISGSGWTHSQADVFTTAFRKVREGLTGQGTGRIHWDLNDNAGLPVASGLYYLRVVLDGTGGKTTRVFKVLVIR